MDTNKSEKQINNDNIASSSMLRKNIIKFQNSLKGNVFFGLFILGSLIVIAGLMVLVFSLSGRISVSNKARNESFKIVEAKQAVIDKANNEMYTARLSGAFTDAQLMKMKDKFTEYAIYVNNVVVKGGTSVIYSKTENISVSFYEKYSTDAKKFFPLDTLRKYCKIAQDVLEKNVIINTNEADYKITTLMLDTGRKVTLDFSNVKAGEIIAIDMQYDMAKALGLDDGSIEIFYNVTK